MRDNKFWRIIYCWVKIFHYQRTARSSYVQLNCLSRSLEKIDCYLSCNPHANTRGRLEHAAEIDCIAAVMQRGAVPLFVIRGRVTMRSRWRHLVLRATSFPGELNASRNFSGSSVRQSVKASAREFRGEGSRACNVTRQPRDDTPLL